MRVVLLLLVASILASASYLVSGVDRVEFYAICGAYSSYDFGVCKGNCTGFVAALSGDLRQAKVLVGGKPAELLYVKELVLDDRYKPRLLVAVFRASWPGKVAVVGLSDFEAYVLINHGVGDRRYVYKLFVVPFAAGRDHTDPFPLRLGLTGEFWACTTGKYAAKVETDGRLSDFKTGYYMSLARGYGSQLTFYWADVASVRDSAVKLLYVFVRAPVLYRAYVVGLDGRPVPAQYLAYIVKRGNVAGDGVVAFEDFGVVSVGGSDVVLKPNETYTVPGRPCTVTGYTSLGTPLELELVYGGQVAARGSGSVIGYCIEGGYRVRYRFSKSGAVSYQLEGEVPGNVTVETARVTFVVLSLFQQPWAVIEEEVPLGKRVELRVGDFSAALVPQPPVMTIQRYSLYTPWSILTLAVAVVGAVIAIVFNKRDYAVFPVVALGVVSSTIILLYVLNRVLNLLPLRQVLSIELDTLTAVSGLVAPLAYLVVSTPWRLWPWAIPSAVLASLYAAAAWTSLRALEPWHIFVFMFAWIAFYFGLHGITMWICPCTPKPHGPEEWREEEGSVDPELLRRVEAIGREVKAVKDGGRIYRKLARLAAMFVVNKWEDKCINEMGNILECAYVRGFIDGRQYRALRDVFKGKGGLDAICQKVLHILGLANYVSICKDVDPSYTPTAEDRTRRYCGPPISIMNRISSNWPLVAMFVFSVLLLPYWGGASLVFFLTTATFYILITAVFHRSIRHVIRVIPVSVFSFVVLLLLWNFLIDFLSSVFNFGYEGVALLAAATAIALVTPYLMYLLLYELTRRGKGVTFMPCKPTPPEEAETEAGEALAGVLAPHLRLPSASRRRQRK